MTENDLKNRASQWFVRLRSADLSESEKLEYANWLSEDDNHVKAYKMIEKEWLYLQELETWAAEEISQLEPQIIPPKRSWSILHLLSGLTVTAVVATLMFTIMLPMHKYGNQSYETMKGEQRKIVLEDGSRIHLNSSSSMTVNFTDTVREIKLQAGEGLFDVAHERDRPFIVKVLDSNVVAVGTSFSVHYKKDEIAVTVLEGRVAIVPAAEAIDDIGMTKYLNTASAGVLVEPDQQANVSNEDNIATLITVDAEKITAWNRGLLILDNTPLREVAEEISRYIVGDVLIAKNVPEHLVTGVIKITDQETMFQLLSEVVPITPVRQSSQLIVLYSSEAKPALFNSD